MWPIGVRVEANPLRPARANSLFGLPFFELFLDRCSASDFCEIAETAANSSKSGPGPARLGRRMAGGWSSRLRETHIFKKRPKIGKSAKTGKRPKVLEGIHRSAFWGGPAGCRIRPYRRAKVAPLSANTLIFTLESRSRLRETPILSKCVPRRAHFSRTKIVNYCCK